MSAASAHTAFEHQALLYDGIEELVARTAPFVRDGLAGGEPVLVVMTSDRLEAVRRALGDDAGRVHLADMAQIGRNPARIIPALQRFLDEDAGGRVPVRVAGEPIWAGRPGDELIECQRTEALLNIAFADRAGLRLLCLYDRSALGADVLHEARCSHPVVVEDGIASRSPELRDGGAPDDDPPLPPPPGAFDALAVERRTLREARALVARRATEAGLSGWRVQDAGRAVHELAANSVRHGGGEGVLRIWRSEAGLVCEVRDRGHITDPLAGRRRPAPDATSGRGLWVATQVADLLQIRTSPSGSALRLVMRLG